MSPLRRATWLFLPLLLAVSTSGAADFKIEISAKPVGQSQYLVEVEIRSNVPGTIQIILDLGLANQKPTDVFIGTNERVTVRNGRAVATIGKPGLPAGRYDVKASFYPRWGPQDDAAKAAGITAEIHARAVVVLKGTGESASAAQARNTGRRWVMENIIGGSRWDRSAWVGRFGQPERLTSTRLNPEIIKVYHFKS